MKRNETVFAVSPTNGRLLAPPDLPNPALSVLPPGLGRPSAEPPSTSCMKYVLSFRRTRRHWAEPRSRGFAHLSRTLYSYPEPQEM